MHRERTPAMEAPPLQWQRLGLVSASQAASIVWIVTDVERNRSPSNSNSPQQHIFVCCYGSLDAYQLFHCFLRVSSGKDGPPSLQSFANLEAHFTEAPFLNLQLVTP